MEPSDLLRYAAGVLENMRLRYFVTGSTATILYGEVRFTNDIDIVLGGSDKHLRDIAGILKVSRGQIDMEYIDQWAATLGVAEIWEAARRFASMNTDH